MKQFFLSLLLGGVAIALHAQPAMTTRTLGWATYFQKFKLPHRLELTLEEQARYDLGRNEWFQLILRPSLSWSTSNDWQFTAGFGYFWLYPSPNDLPPRHEFRPWQEIGRKRKYGRTTLQPKIRFEQRYIRGYNGEALADDYTYSTWRSRFRCDVQVRLQSDENRYFYFTGGDELFFNTLPGAYTVYDQNRAYAGLGYQFGSKVSVQAQYLNAYVRKSSAAYELQHVARLTVTHTFNLQSKEK